MNSLQTYTPYVVNQADNCTQNGGENNDVGYSFFPISIVLNKMAKIDKNNDDEYTHSNIREDTFNFICQLLCRTFQVDALRRSQREN